MPNVNGDASSARSRMISNNNNNNMVRLYVRVQMGFNL